MKELPRSKTAPPQPLTLAQGGAWIGGLQNPVEFVRGLSEVLCYDRDMMKVTLFPMFVALLMAGCEEGVVQEEVGPVSNNISQEAASISTILVTKEDGLHTEYYENGQKRSETNWKNGKRDGPLSNWNENGQKIREGNWKANLLDGFWNTWYENEQRERQEKYKDGKLISCTVWKMNGEKCNATNIKDGNGVVVNYYENGTEQNRLFYKAGSISGSKVNW